MCGGSEAAAVWSPRGHDFTVASVIAASGLGASGSADVSCPLHWGAHRLVAGQWDSSLLYDARLGLQLLRELRVPACELHRERAGRGDLPGKVSAASSLTELTAPSRSS